MLWNTSEPVNWKCASIPAGYYPTRELSRRESPASSGLLPSSLASSIASICTSVSDGEAIVPALHCLLHAGYTEISQPSLHIHLYVLHHYPDIPALAPASQFLQLFLRLLQRLCVGTDKHSRFSLSKGKAEILKISDSIYAYRAALLPVHFQLQFLLQIPGTAFQQPFCRTLAFRQQHNVVCVADDFYAPTSEFLVELVQVYSETLIFII